MSGVTRTDEVNNSQLEKSKVITNSDYTQPSLIFNAQLTVSQASAIAKLLPLRYSLHIDRTIKTKRVVKKKFTMDAKNYKNSNEGSEGMPPNEMVEEPSYGAIQTMNYDEVMRKCQKILNLLRKNKHSWAFKQPVDPVAMGIPHYRDIISEPMDLRTVGQNLQSHKYSTISQFYADIQLIIKNSYTFNKNNLDFCAITSEFQKYFEKLKSEPITPSKPDLSIIKKASTKTTSIHKKESETNSSDLAQRKELAMKLKYLPRQELTQLVHRINDAGQKNMELNLQILSISKIRILQEYIARRESAAKQREEMKNTLEAESSFQSDSDS